MEDLQTQIDDLNRKLGAEKLKTKQQTVSRIERGGQNLTLDTLERIAHVLGKDLQVRFVAAGKV